MGLFAKGEYVLTNAGAEKASTMDDANYYKIIVLLAIRHLASAKESKITKHTNLDASIVSETISQLKAQGYIAKV